MRMESSHRSKKKRWDEDPEWRAKEQERRRKQMREWRAANPERARANDRNRKRKRWAEDPEWRERQIVGRLCNRYGITVDRYYEMLAEQQERCAICGYRPTESERRLAVDHDHGCCDGKKSCGKCVRGLLCTHCNNGLGRFTDDPALLRTAADYLERSALATR